MVARLEYYVVDLATRRDVGTTSALSRLKVDRNPQLRAIRISGLSSSCF
jgi:hypothetical protein